MARYAHPTTGSKHSLALNDYLEAQLFGCLWAEACGGCGEEGGVGGGGRRWLCWVVVWQTGSYAGHTPQPPWAAHSHPPSPHQPPLHTTPTHKCLGCSPYCVHQSAGGCRPAVAPCRWGGGGAGLLPRRLEGIKVVMARLLVATSSVQPTSPWQDRTPCTTTHTHHTHKLGNFRSWHGEDQGSHAVGSGRVGRGAERRGWVKHGSPTWSVFEMCGGVELAAAKKPAKMVGTLRAVATPCSPLCMIGVGLIHNPIPPVGVACGSGDGRPRSAQAATL